MPEYMKHLVVREAIDSDAADLERVSQSAIATLRQTYCPTPEAVAHRRSIVPALIQLVAVFHDVVVGSVEYRVEGDRVHFLSLFVHHDHRQQGVGRRLIAELHRIGRRRRLRCLSTYTVCQTGNPEVFRRLGFEIVSEEPATLYESDRFDNLTEVYMEYPVQ